MNPLEIDTQQTVVFAENQGLLASLEPGRLGLRKAIRPNSEGSLEGPTRRQNAPELGPTDGVLQNRAPEVVDKVFLFALLFPLLASTRARGCVDVLPLGWLFVFRLGEGFWLFDIGQAARPFEMRPDGIVPGATMEAMRDRGLAAS